MKLGMRLLCVALVVGAVAVIVANQKTAARLRADNQELSNAKEEAAQLAGQNAQIEQLRAENVEVQKLRRANKDLPKLRNDIRQLRREVEGLQAMREENQRLAATQSKAVNMAAARPMLPGFVPKNSMADAGLGTPEATVQTLFWAMSHGNIERATQCRAEGGVGQTQDTEQERQDLIKGFANFPGYAITGRQDVSADAVVLQVKTSASGEGAPVKLVRVNNEWKVMEN